VKDTFRFVHLGVRREEHGHFAGVLSLKDHGVTCSAGDDAVDRGVLSQGLSTYENH
jgi:hypothetical protein